MKIPRWLQTLNEQGTVPHSAANSAAGQAMLRKLRDELKLVRVATRGTRRTIVVDDAMQLQRWLDARYPQTGLDPDTLPTRQGNIVRGGGSKAGRRTHTVQPVLFKFFDPRKTNPWARQTARYGMAAATTNRLHRLDLPPRWRLLTVENWEPFQRADYAAASIPVMVVYLLGKVADVTIRALATFSPPPESMLHFGDYDWEGLYVFQRLAKVLPAMRLYVPAGIEDLFKIHRNRELIAKQTPAQAFDRQNRHCRPVIRLIQHYNGGLEQEIVDLPVLD